MCDSNNEICCTMNHKPKRNASYKSVINLPDNYNDIVWRKRKEGEYNILVSLRP